ncbi:MAG: hypothetical protein IJ825_01225 [Oscillospiraceae bacterium]|nr:hypothetical protein [Oscillospiraceae bacterium]
MTNTKCKKCGIRQRCALTIDILSVGTVIGTIHDDQIVGRVLFRIWSNPEKQDP